MKNKVVGSENYNKTSLVFIDSSLLEKAKKVGGAYNLIG